MLFTIYVIQFNTFGTTNILHANDLDLRNNYYIVILKIPVSVIGQLYINVNFGDDFLTDEMYNKNKGYKKTLVYSEEFFQSNKKRHIQVMCFIINLSNSCEYYRLLWFYQRLQLIVGYCDVNLVIALCIELSLWINFMYMLRHCWCNVFNIEEGTGFLGFDPFDKCHFKD